MNPWDRLSGFMVQFRIPLFGGRVKPSLRPTFTGPDDDVSRLRDSHSDSAVGDPFMDALDQKRDPR